MISMLKGNLRYRFHRLFRTQCIQGNNRHKLYILSLLSRIYCSRHNSMGFLPTLDTSRSAHRRCIDHSQGKSSDGTFYHILGRRIHQNIPCMVLYMGCKRHSRDQGRNQTCKYCIALTLNCNQHTSLICIASIFRFVGDSPKRIQHKCSRRSTSCR